MMEIAKAANRTAIMGVAQVTKNSKLQRCKTPDGQNLFFGIYKGFVITYSDLYIECALNGDCTSIKPYCYHGICTGRKEYENIEMQNTD